MRTFFLGALLGLTLAGCESKPAPPAPAASASSAAPAPSGSAAVETYGVQVVIPGDAKRVVDAVNPKHEKPYAGPKGTLKGRVRIEGDPPPDTNLKFPPNCKEAQATYAKLFRVGLDNALADAMVAVTGYDGFVPAAGPAAKAPIRGCAVNKRTVVMTYGQRLEVANLDKLDSYVPFLDGAPSRAGMVAVPGGEAVKLYPPEPGHYMIRDTMPSGLVADVFVLKYATHDVTGLDGQYEIKDIPVGKVQVNVFLPVLNKSQGQAFEVKEGDNTLDITFKFDAKKDVPGAAPAGSGSASAKPAAPPPDAPKVPR
ncbi:MAG: hypothetical protein QM820_31585 [Minicystis sp.]